MLQEDRLKAFLERNRNRISQNSESSHISALQSSQLAQSEIIKNLNTESSKPSSINNIDNLLSSQEMRTDLKASGIYDPIRKARKDYPDIQNNSNFFSTTSSDSFAHQFDIRSHLMTTETPQKGSYPEKYQTSDFKTLKLTKTLDSTGKKKSNIAAKSRYTVSTSPARNTPWENTLATKNKNRIEDYINKRKESKSKIRDRVRSLSNDSSNNLRPLRSSFRLNTSTRSKGYDSNSRSSIVNETQELMNTTKSSNVDRLSRSQLFDSFLLRQNKPPNFTKKGKTKTKGAESREYCFEETEEPGKRVKSKSDTKAKSRSKSRTASKSPIRSLIDKTKAETSKANYRSSTQSTKSRDKSAGKKNSKFFPESSKKLVVLDSSLDSGHKFKKEIKVLIGVIKKEREQITSELDTMTKELKKYKAAYRALKKEVASKKTFNDMSQEKSSSNSPNASKNKIKNKSKIKDKDDKMSYPFTINELTQYIENSVPVQNEENIEDLLANIDVVHTDVETILKKSDSDVRSPQKRGQDPKTFELRRTPVNCFVIKEMNLQPSLFFRDTNPEEPLECKPNLIDLLAAQREIIYYLVKKLEIEEQQRLKTEEQASKMILSMEKTIKALEGKNNSAVKKREASGQLDLNKSEVSQVSFKSEKLNQTFE